MIRNLITVAALAALGFNSGVAGAAGPDGAMRSSPTAAAPRFRPIWPGFRSRTPQAQGSHSSRRPCSTMAVHTPSMAPPTEEALGKRSTIVFQ